jgi:hypothetical protein
MSPFLRETKNTHMVGGWKLNFTFYFMDPTQRFHYVRQMKFGTVKSHRHTYKFYLNHYFLWWNFQMWRWCEILRLFRVKRVWPLCVTILCNSYFSKLFSLLLINIIQLFNWYDNGIILKPQFHFMTFLSKVFSISAMLTLRPKYSWGYI